MSHSYTIARPYAKAVFELARDGAFAKWSEMLALAAQIARSKEMIALMKDPKFSSDQVLALFFDIAKDSFTQEMKNLCQTLAQFQRMAVLPEIYELYEEMRKNAERTISVELVSAYPMDENYQMRFKQALKQKTNCDIQLKCVTDKSILGGAIIRAGDLLIDGSVRGRLARLGDAVGIL